MSHNTTTDDPSADVFAAAHDKYMADANTDFAGVPQFSEMKRTALALQTATQGARAAVQAHLAREDWPEEYRQKMAQQTADQARSKAKALTDQLQTQQLVLTKSLQAAATPAEPSSAAEKALARDEMRLELDHLNDKDLMAAVERIATGADRVAAATLAGPWGRKYLTSRGSGELAALAATSAVRGSLTNGTAEQRAAAKRLGSMVKVTRVGAAFIGASGIALDGI